MGKEKLPDGFSKASKLPEGYKQVTPDRILRWLVKSEGVILHGVLLGEFEGNNGPYYQVRLESPCLVSEKVGDETREVEAGIGDTINVDAHKALRDVLHALCDSSGEYSVHATYGAKIDIDSGHTFWPVVVGVNTLQAPAKV